MRIRCTLLAAFLLGSLVAPASAVEPAAAAPTPKFLTLPFSSVRNMHVQQAWDFGNGQHQVLA